MVASLFCVCIILTLFHHSTNDFQPRSGDCEWRGSRNNGSCRTVEEDTPSPTPAPDQAVLLSLKMKKILRYLMSSLQYISIAIGSRFMLKANQILKTYSCIKASLPQLP